MSLGKSVIMIGAPDSGKTNYLGRLWGALDGKNASLRATQQPDDVSYVLHAFNCILGGRFAPRTETNVDVDGSHCSVEVAWDRNDGPGRAAIVVPDVSGELWTAAVQRNELLETWLTRVRESVGALLFVRVESELHAPSLDWVAASKRLEVSGGEIDPVIPTDVQLCEFLRFLELFLGRDASAPETRVAVLVAAWDILDEVRSQQGPRAYLRREFPLFAGRLADVSAVDVEVFGVSVVGGDFRDQVFRDRFLNGKADEFGYVVSGSDGTQGDVTTPVRWVLDGKPGR